MTTARPFRPHALIVIGEQKFGCRSERLTFNEPATESLSAADRAMPRSRPGGLPQRRSAHRRPVRSERETAPLTRGRLPTSSNEQTLKP